MRTAPFGVRAERIADGLSVIAVRGEADLYSAPTLKEHILAEVEAGATHIVVDLTAVTFVDSTTIGVLVHTERSLRPLNGRIALVVTDANVARVLKITALDRVFAIHSTRADAISHLRAEDASRVEADPGPRRLEHDATSSAS